MGETPAYILDSFALLAYLQGEPAGQSVQRVLQEAGRNKCRLYISIINVGEILYNVERTKGLASAQDTLLLLQELPIEILPADNATVLAAAHIKANHAISYADAFVVVAAQQINGIIMTGDPEFKQVTEFAQVEWLRKKT